MMDFSKLTDEELEKAKEIVNAEINKRYREERERAREELEKLLGRVNELQDKYGFEISCVDEYDGSWIDSASDFALR